MDRWSPEVVAIGDRIAGLTLARTAELRRYLEDVHGLRPVSAPAPKPKVIILRWDVRLEGFDPARKINAIKAMREMSNLGLKEARDLVEGPPRALKEGLELAEAEKLRDHLTAVGLKVALVPAAAVAG